VREHGERPTVAHGAAGVLMLCGIAILLRSHHEHLHEHVAAEATDGSHRFHRVAGPIFWKTATVATFG